MQRESPVCQKQLPSNVALFDQQTDLTVSHEEVKDIVRAVLSVYQVETDEIIFHFVDTKTICRLHDEYFDDPSVTDCITFPIDPPGSPSPSILGEVFVCPKTACDYDQDHPYEELTLYIVHGLLHLLGYDDIDPEDQKVMREQEARCLEILKKDGKILTNRYI